MLLNGPTRDGTYTTYICDNALHGYSDSRAEST